MSRTDEVSGSTSGPRVSVTPEDIEDVVRQAVAVLRQAPPEKWAERAGSLEWDCWETVEHVADDLFCYATQLAPRSGPVDGYVPFVMTRQREGGPKETLHAERDAGVEGLVQVLEASAGLLVAMVRTRPPEARAHHSYGVSDPEGFAAMGVIETLVHLHDIADGLGVEWRPDAGLCERVLRRLFRDVPVGDDPWRTLLWATGRVELPGLGRRESWRWNGTTLD
ncbi:hypothetical protein J1792_30255 [Streptomyces triculaminicus]|uniref:Mycothiol-dependent maleylpyruvate isomerase metal-binding domain-containing protein n=1 Tax=Streptomyces triculaminicus TaxID=2816232 RepID=A0A939FT48_9ACTN|nr:maleylpyruvate isomerase N-terminal domain-containing protein [Streptomyces triculaminicus]MBO0656867.1 hypothetical protein [Streptomyces triculaminicus]